MKYLDNLANRAGEVNRTLPKDATLHLARSCFAILLQDAHREALQEGATHNDFRDSARAVIDDLELPIFTQVDNSVYLPGKRQPSLVESLDATIDRYIVIDELNGIFSDSAEAMIYGGSMKYGPFLNVRSGGDASDIDTIIITEEKHLDRQDWRGVMETDLFENQDKVTFFARMALQRALSEDGLVDITSQRFTFARRGYTISTHIMPKEYLHEAYPVKDEDLAGDHRYVRDFKERPFERTHVNNYDMSRALHNIPVYSFPAQGGFIVNNPAYSLIDDRYIPGMYQNLVIPDARFVLGEDSPSAERLRAFSAFVSERESKERLVHTGASLENTEPRKPILAADVSAILNS